MTNTYQELLSRAKWSSLTANEVKQVAHDLQSPTLATHQYTLLHILGRAGALQYQRLVEQFLKSEQDPMLARLALQILANYWNRADQYREEILQFVRGVPWDQEDDVRPVAIVIAGDYVRSHQDPELLHELITMFENELEDPSRRQHAYLALGRAVGRDWSELPSSTREFDPVTETDPTILQAAKQRLLAGG